MFLDCQHALTVRPAGQTNYTVRGLPLAAQPTRSHSLNLETLDANAAVDSDGCSGTSLKSGTSELGFAALGVDGSWNDACVSGRAIFSPACLQKTQAMSRSVALLQLCKRSKRGPSSLVSLAFLNYFMERLFPPCWIVMLKNMGYSILSYPVPSEFQNSPDPIFVSADHNAAVLLPLAWQLSS